MIRTTPKTENRESFECAVCGQEKPIAEINYNCTGEEVCNDCQEDYYNH